MYPTQLSEGIFEEHFSYAPLRKIISESVTIIDIHIEHKDFNEANPLEIDEEHFKEELSKVPNDKPSLINFRIPSLFNSQAIAGGFVIIKHAVSAVIDPQKKRIYLQEPYAGLTIPAKDPDLEDEKICKFPTIIKERLQKDFDGYEIFEATTNTQNRGEQVCYLIALLRTHFIKDDVVEKNPFVTREYLEANWLSIMAEMNKASNNDFIVGLIKAALHAEINARLLLTNGITIDICGNDIGTIINTREISNIFVPITESERNDFFNLMQDIIFNTLPDDQSKIDFGKIMFEYINRFDRGKLTKDGEEFINQIVSEIQKQFPTLFTVIDKNDGIITHKLTPDFKANHEKVDAIKAYVRGLQEHMLNPKIKLMLSAPSSGFK